ncbi:MAG TPA: hypothetical protein VNT32_08950 [Thermoleophilaceae bacterium]|nr:hypothetical protein [Thermoleophilaceae bacterium]
MRPVNLMPEDQRREAGARPNSSYILLGALGTILVGALLYVFTANGITSKEEEVSKLRAETQQAEARAGAFAAYQSFAQIKQTRVASVAGLAQARLDWERLMRELALVMPSNAYVTSVDATAGGVPAGTADPAAAVANGPTMTVTGCTDSHSDVATVLVRLRKLFRAQDVNLSVSDRGTGGDGQPGAGAAVSGSCGSGAQWTAVVSFTPAAPASEVPSGEKQVPASLGGGS